MKIIKQLQLECVESKNSTRKRRKRFSSIEIDKRDVDAQMDHFLSIDDEDLEKEGTFHPPVNSSHVPEFLCGNISFV